MNEAKRCEHVYPEGDPHERGGKQCGAYKRKGSRFCTYHRPSKEWVNENLARARDILSEMRKIKDFRDCNLCSHKSTCDHYVKDSVDNCAYFEMHEALPNLDLNSLQSIKSVEEELVRTMVTHLNLLDQQIRTDPTPEKISHYSRVAKRLSSINKDYAVIQDLFKKRQKQPDLIKALSLKKEDWR